MKKRFLAVLLTLAMLLSVLPASALAAEGTADEAAVCTVTEGCTLEAGHDGECVLPDEPEIQKGDTSSYYEFEDVYGVDDDTVVISPIQERINDLPSAEELSEMDAEEQAEVYTEVCAIYNTIDELTDEEAAELDTTALEEAAAFFTQQIMTLDNVAATAITATGGELANGDYQLTGNITLTTDLTIPVNAEVTIDLNGYTLTGSGNDSVITVYGTLTVKDSGTTGKITGGQGPSEDTDDRGAGGGGIYVAEGATLTLTGGTITGNKATYGGGLCVDGTLYMIGGKITENEATFGGGIYSNSDTTGAITMSGGEISENKAATAGGGVRAGGVLFTMSGGTISNNSITGTGSTFGAGVQAFRAFTMSGGTISGNTGAAMGGGVFVQATLGSFTMQGGTISENTATSTGGGVYTAGTFTMSAGTISKNSANNGGGVDCAGGTMSMSSGSITENTATNNGGGVRAGGTSFTMTGGEISKNTATNGQGGGIWASKPATISAGKITGNSANTLGGGIFISGNTPVTISGGEVTENIVTSATGGAGIYFAASGALHVSGSPVITGNKANSSTEQNVYLPGNVYITLDGALDGASIGITPSNVNLPNVNVPLQITASESSTSYYSSSYNCFKADVSTRQLGNDSCIVIPQANTADSKNYVELAIYISRTVTFNSNDGKSAQTKTQVVPKEKATALDANTFTRTGYTFQNWSTQTGGGDTTYQNGANITTSGDVTLYAQWKANEYTITYNLNGGTAGESAPSTHTYDTATALVEPTRDGYDFGGWFTNSDFSGTKITSLGSTDYTDNITLYALWTKTIGENGNYAVDEIPAQTYTGKAITPDVVVRNKTFGDIIASSQYSVEYKDNTDAGTASVTITKGSDTVTVNFTINQDTSPTVEMADVSVTYGTEYAMTATAKTSADNEITGENIITIKYYTDKDCTKGETDAAPTNAGTYYAKATLTGTDNYAEATKIAKIEISNATFSVTATGYSGTYDGQAHSITVAAEDASVTYSTDGTNYSETNPTFINAGTYNVYYKASKANHNDVTGSVSVEISKATLIITAANQTIYVGGTLPTAYTYTVSGLVGEDTESIITTQPTMACSAADANTAGTYTITASSANAGENYTITYVDGALTIATVETGEAFKVEVNKGFDTVPTGLSSKYNTVGDLTSDLKTKITTANSSVSASNIVVYDVTLMVNLNDGNGWVNADATHFPANGRLTITLPYPEGTNSNYKFTVVHMFTTSDFGRTPGDTETPNVTNTSSGLQFSVTGLSPISVGWTAPTSGGSSHSGGGSSSSSSYTVTVDSAKNGTVKADRTSASKGTTVTLTVTPKDGYELDSLTVTDKNGDTVKLTRKSDTQYTFTMPASKVTVEASFTKIAEQPKVSFVDVPTSAYYYDAVAWAVENGVTAGTSATTFSPDASCTRAQAVTFLWRAAGSPAPKSSVNPFADVPASAYYYDAVLWAVEQGITAGTSATTFSPDATCTRAQIVTFLYRADGTATTSNNPFVDVADSAYYANAVKWAVSEGVTAGTSATTFSPDAFCTRAQIVTFLYRAYA